MRRPVEETLANEELQLKFFDALLTDGVAGYIPLACKKIGISTATAYKYRRENREFADRWDYVVSIAQEMRTGIAEATLWQKATLGEALPEYRAEWIPEEDCAKINDPFEALIRSKIGPNVVGFKYSPPDMKALDKWLNAHLREKYNPPKASIHAHIDGKDALIEAIVKEAQAKGLRGAESTEHVRNAVLFMVNKALKASSSEGVVIDAAEVEREPVRRKGQ